jgi:CheY-like chemotaxis protein
VADSGIGLTASEIRKLFRPFTQANEAVARRYGGTGLGLSLVKRLARAMGGDLSVSSKPGQGSTFHLHVLVQTPAIQEGKRHGRSARAVAVPERRHVLCVEDNPYGRVLLNTILSNLGHRAEFAGSGEKAVEGVKAGGFDLVLMDVALSGMSGLDATRRIRALPAPAGQIPIIGISGSSDREREAIKSGMNAYLSKPVGPAELAAAIEKAFAH